MKVKHSTKDKLVLLMVIISYALFASGALFIGIPSL